MNRTRVILQTMITLAAASFGLVAALAWNEAIKALIREVLGDDGSIVALFIYAILATLIAVVVLLILASAAARVGSDAVINREAEG
jgi:hypothetical protein